MTTHPCSNLTPTTALALAEVALAEIAATPPAHVYASRRRIVAACQYEGQGHAIAFRRIGGEVRLEFWPREFTCAESIRVFPLTPSLAARARKMLDNL